MVETLCSWPYKQNVNVLLEILRNFHPTATIIPQNIRKAIRAMKTPAARILSTEDDSDTRDLIQFVLEREADDAEHAVTLARTEKFHLYLLDAWTPDVAGADICRSLRELDQTTPILFYSGASSDADQAAAIKAGAQGYVVKPSNPDILLREIVGLLDRN